MNVSCSRGNGQRKLWSCHMCLALFQSMFDLMQHMKSAHHRSSSWTCGRLHKEVKRAYNFAFNRSHSYTHPGEDVIGLKSIMCGFCGKQSSSPSCDMRTLEEHLKRVHNYDGCEHSADSYGINRFLQHLEHSHGALRGSWLSIIMAACRTTELFTPINIPASDEKTSVQTRDASTQTASEASSSGIGMIEFQETLNRSNLLEHWSGTRDRINRWLLYSLVTDETQAQLHKSQIPGSDLDEPTWMRLVLRYWFIDEAATGVEIAHSLSGGAVGSRTGSSLMSSEPSEYYTCEEGSEVGSRKVCERITMSSSPHSVGSPQSMMGQFNTKVSFNTQKKHKCKVCDKRFARPSSLQTHMYSHTGEKTYACRANGCGRHFSVVSNLRRHQKVHEGDRNNSSICEWSSD